MFNIEIYDVVVIGAGPAGLAAGLGAKRNGAKTLIIERESREGGILKQCVHDGFGLLRFNEKLSGPEYAERYIKMVINEDIPILMSTFASKIEKRNDHFVLTLINSWDGAFLVQTKALILANGCREKTAKQVSIYGSRPSGIFTAGTAQYFVNILGYLPCRRCVVLGSGDIGLIMARRLTLEGAKVIGVYEAKPNPSGLSRNIIQCLSDYSIPMYLSRTVTRVLGDERVEGVVTVGVDNNMKPIPGTESIIECDGIILSVGLIPENEIADSLQIKMDERTKGPFVDQNFMTLLEGVFICGNALHVNDLVDYVSENGECAGENAALYTKEDEKKSLIPVVFKGSEFQYIVPQFINIESNNKNVVLYFRSKEVRHNVSVRIKCNDTTLFYKKYPCLKPPEMGKVCISLYGTPLSIADSIEIDMLEG